MKSGYTMTAVVILAVSAFSAQPAAGASGDGAEQKDTIFVRDYGIRPDSHENQTVRLQQAIADCRRLNAKVLQFEEGRYDFWPDGAVRREYFISNTSSEGECPSKVKTIGIMLDNIDNLTIDGNGAALVFHGKMTMIATDHCRGLAIRNLHIDFERPGGSELIYLQHDSTGVTVKFHPDSKYEIDHDGHIFLVGEGWQVNIPHCIEYDPDTGHFTYSGGWKVLTDSEAVETAPGTVHFATPSDFRPKVGNTLTIRDIIRDQVGMFLYESMDITLDNVGVHYMHGLGIVSQYTENITMRNVCCEPEEGSGRILASSADFMHFSGCRGRVRILGCRFAGAQDDLINVHGTNLRAIEKTGSKSLTVRFMHSQSYGFDAYFPGDTIAFVNAATMQRYANAVVNNVKRLTERTLELTFDRDIPESIRLGHDCVENMTWTPEVEIRDCRLTRTSTRGILVTTPRKVVIADNIYCRTGMSAILIEGDASGWYESGPVKDVLIQGNTFIDCAYNGGPGQAFIAMNPSNTVVDEDLPVHSNVRITGNRFITSGNPVVFAKSTENLIFRDNIIKVEADISDATPEALDRFLIFIACRNASVQGNAICGASDYSDAGL